VVNNLITNDQPFAVVQIHMNDGYQTTWGDSRAGFYGNLADGLPWFAFDGLEDGWPISNYDDQLDMRQAVPTDVLIGQWAIETGAQTYDVTAEVCVEVGGTGKTMDVYMVQVLDNYPTTAAYYRNCLMQGAAKQQITVASGACETVTNTFTMGTTSWNNQDDIRIIAWAQTPATGWPAEVHQAHEMAWPFPAPPPPALFEDGFESGDTTFWSSSMP